MFINKSSDGLNNICGRQVAKYRKKMKLSQRRLSDALQLLGLNLDKNAIQRVECGKRFVTDIELVYFAKILNVSYETLLSDGKIPGKV